MFKWFRRRKALKSYYLILGPELKKSCPESRLYRPELVAELIDKHNLSKEFFPYAIAMYCSKIQFENGGIGCEHPTITYEAARSAALNIMITSEVYGGGSGSSFDGPSSDSPGSDGSGSDY